MLKKHNAPWPVITNFEQARRAAHIRQESGWAWGIVLLLITGLFLLTMEMVVRPA